MIWVGICVGGFVGAVLRYVICLGLSNEGVLIANTLGTFVLSLMFGLKPRLNQNLDIGLKTGFCGALTTFSTFCLEIYNHYVQNDGVMPYVLLGIGIPLITVVLGYRMGIWLKGTWVGDCK